jgi:LPS sulfotransferase NodH
MKTNPTIESIFAKAVVDPERLETAESLPEPRSRYIIAMTPRSGSSWLCAALKATRRLGRPDEALNAAHIPNVLMRVPGRTPEAYLRNVTRVWSSRNRVSGLKVSWCQFRDFAAAMQDRSYLTGFRWIYLTRRDLAAQAVSLYKAVETSVWHTNVSHADSALEKLDALEYRYECIAEWYRHIVQQERGWQAYFFQRRIFPLCLNYEDLEYDLPGAVKRIATFVGVNPDKVSLPAEPTVFRKIGDERNIEWARRLVLDLRRDADASHGRAR